MAISEALLPEFDQEMANMRNVLERVPGSKFEWRPHQKSGTMGWLAGHLANLPSWVPTTINCDELDLAGRTGLLARNVDERSPLTTGSGRIPPGYSADPGPYELPLHREY